MILLRTLILTVMVIHIYGSNNNIARLDRIWKARKSVCEKEDCSHLIFDEAYNCVNECISKICYDEVYAGDPLEDGEIDNGRMRLFTSCLRKEAKAHITGRGRSTTKQGNTVTSENEM